MNDIISGENISPEFLKGAVDDVREKLDGDLASDFSSFETFRDWMDACYHYEELDTGQSATNDLYRVVYDQLIAEESSPAGVDE